MDWTLGIAIVSLVISMVAIFYAHRADRRQEDAERRDRVRFAREASEAEAARRADLLVTEAGSTGTVDADERSFQFILRNRGPAAATRIRLWLVDEASNVVSSVDEYPMLAAGEATEGRRQLTLRGRQAYPLTLWVSWNDDAGRHERPDKEVT